MIDELHELGRANPETPEAVAPLVTMDRVDLINALDADSHARWSPFVLLRRWWRTVGGLAPAPVVMVRGIVVLASVMLLALAAVEAGLFADPAVQVVDSARLPRTTAQEPAPASQTTLSTTSSSSPAVSRPTDTQATPSSVDPSTTAPSDPELGPATTSSGPAIPLTEAPTTTLPLPTPTTSAVAATTTIPPTNPPSLVSGPIDPATDLLAVHFDFAHRDDGHAAMATQEIATWFGLDPLVVAGTKATESSWFVHPYDEMMGAAWANGWLDAGGDRAGAVSTAADQWLDVIDAGGDVWIAEGGVSDFTAEVIRDIQPRRPGLDLTARIHVVQHNQRNEDETRPDELALVISAADYVRIEDGNGANNTADLKGPSGVLVDAALAGPRGAGWATAFDYMEADGLDFSDTVGLLHIVGVGTDQVADADDFATLFMSGSPG